MKKPSVSSDVEFRSSEVVVQIRGAKVCLWFAKQDSKILYRP